MSKEEAMEMRNFTMANSELTQSEDIAFDTVAKGYL